MAPMAPMMHLNIGLCLLRDDPGFRARIDEIDRQIGQLISTMQQ
jgi:hypothetical protein